MEDMMKQLWIMLFCLIVAPAFAAVENYTIDPNHSYVLWRINHLGFSQQSGKWMAQGTLQLDKDHPNNDKVSATINVFDMITGNAELDKNLKGPEFFNVDQFPTASFISNTVDVSGSKTATVKGILTLHGVSKPVTLNVTFNHAAKNPVTNKMTVGFSATTRIKRSDFGMTAYIPLLSDEVMLNIETEAYLDDSITTTKR
jgi:polyisoprenoid-binding protein YceI